MARFTMQVNHRRFLHSSFHALPPSLVGVGAAATDTVSLSFPGAVKVAGKDWHNT
jgi:hypothetical protein